MKWYNEREKPEMDDCGIAITDAGAYALVGLLWASALVWMCLSFMARGFRKNCDCQCHEKEDRDAEEHAS